jgi:uncharacterized protein YeaO (DUF488 family)
VIRVVRLGSPRARGEGLRLGTVRRPPRGVKKSDYARRNFYDLWLPELAPSQKLFSWALSQPWTDARWNHYKKAYGKEMNAPAAQHLLALLAALSKETNFAIGCYCENEARCHRSILRRLLVDRGANVAS